MTPGEIRARLADMTEGEREAYTQGARAQIADIMGTARNEPLAARSIFDKGYSKEKLALLIGPEKAQRLLDMLGAEKTFADTRNFVTGNSLTAARQAAQKELGGRDTPTFGLREGYMAGGTLGAARSAGVRTFERIRDAIMGAQQQARNTGLAEVLASKHSPQIIQAIARAQGRRPVNAQLVDEISRALMLGGGTSAARP